MANKPQKSIIKFQDDTFVTGLTSELLKHGRVKVTSLGIFHLKKRLVGFNPVTKTREKIEYIKISFIPSASLKVNLKKWNTKK